MRRHLRILDLGLTLAGPAEHVEPIAFAYRRFAVADPPAGAVPIGLLPDAADVAEVDGRRVELIRGLDRTAQLYQLFLDCVMDRLGSHAVLHAAALLEPGGGAVLLAAPSGHGKTSLTLELVRHGYGFLGDDYAPLDLDRGLVHPYPRAVGLTPDAAARFAGAPLGGPELMGKRLVDVGNWFGEERIVGRPAPLSHVVLLAGSLREPAGVPATRLHFTSRAADADGIDAALVATAGVEVIDRGREGIVASWRVRLDPAQRPTGALSRVLESGRILFVEKTWEERPDFTAKPALAPITRREAAEALGRELLNRRGGGRLFARYGESVAALFVALAGALRGAACHRLRVGAREATAALLADLVRGV